MKHTISPTLRPSEIGEDYELEPKKQTHAGAILRVNPLLVVGPLKNIFEIIDLPRFSMGQ